MSNYRITVVLEGRPPQFFVAPTMRAALAHMLEVLGSDATPTAFVGSPEAPPEEQDRAAATAMATAVLVTWEWDETGT